MDDFDIRIVPWAITLFEHNWPIMADSSILLWAAVRAYQRPTRQAVLLVYGVFALAFGFEYQKHALGSIADTIEYVFAHSSSLRDTARLVLMDGIPLTAYIFGAAVVVVCAVLSVVRKRVATPRR